MKEVRPVHSPHLELGWVELLCQMKKRAWISAEVANLKDCFRNGQIIFLEVVIETSARTPKVWNSCSC